MTNVNTKYRDIRENCCTSAKGAQCVLDGPDTNLERHRDTVINLLNNDYSLPAIIYKVWGVKTPRQVAEANPSFYATERGESQYDRWKRRYAYYEKYVNEVLQERGK